MKPKRQPNARTRWRLGTDVGPWCHAEETGRATAPDEDKRSPVIQLEGAFSMLAHCFRPHPQALNFIPHL